MDEGPTVSFEIDTSALDGALKNLTALSDTFGRQLTQGLASAVIQGRALEDVLRRIGVNLAGMALQQGLQPLSDLAGSTFSGLVKGLVGVLPFEKGGVPGRIVPFADGGVVSQPTFFPAGRDIGLMGEAGAEAILPLSRGPDGRLGVAAGGQAQPVSIVFNVTTPDAASFRKSQAQVTGMIARAAARGARTL
jgi:phage-related minor tail protein